MKRMNRHCILHMKIGEEEDEDEEEVLSVAEEEGDNQSTKLKLNASSVTNLDIFNMNVLSGKKLNYAEVEDKVN